MGIQCLHNTCFIVYLSLQVIILAVADTRVKDLTTVQLETIRVGKTELAEI